LSKEKRFPVNDNFVSALLSGVRLCLWVDDVICNSIWVIHVDVNPAIMKLNKLYRRWNWEPNMKCCPFQYR
jgi:hypothetical protein